MIRDARSADPQDRVTAACWPGDLPEHVLAALAADQFTAIRVRVASRTRMLPEEVLQLLVKDAAPPVRHALARNSSTPGWVLDQLAGDGDVAVRQAVVEHPRASDQAAVTAALLGLDSAPFTVR